MNGNGCGVKKRGSWPVVGGSGGRRAGRRGNNSHH